MTHTSTEQERAEFEAYIKSTPEWLRGAPWLDRTDDGSYKNTNTVFLFGIWQASASRRAQVVPQGWRLVPVEPTTELLLPLLNEGELAAIKNRPEPSEELIPILLRLTGVRERYNAMLAAAPQPPEAESLMSEIRTSKPEAAPVQLQESISKVLEDCRARAIDYATCPSPYNNTRMETAFQFLEHQVRQLLAAHAHGITQAKQGGKQP